MSGDTLVAVPTPEEIRAMCLEIQAEWTEQERERRAVFKTDRVETPVVRGLTGRVAVGKDDAP